MPHTQLPQFQTTRRLTIVLASMVVSAILIFTGLIANMPAIERQLNRWQMLPTGQKLTEFYLEDAEALPKTYKPGQLLTTVATITNRTNETRTYRYRVTQTDEKGKKPVKLLEDRVEIAAGYNTSLHLDVTLQDLGKRSNVNITLIGEGLSLNYWMDRE